MSGSSSNQDGGGTLPYSLENGSGSLNPAGFDSSSLSAFTSSQAGQKYTPEQIAMLKEATFADQPTQGRRYFNKGNNIDLTGLASDYNTWMKGQNASNVDHANYASLSNNSPGRDQTILAGSQRNPNLSALGQS